jgi:hypothetical protein
MEQLSKRSSELRKRFIFQWKEIADENNRKGLAPDPGEWQRSI